MTDSTPTDGTEDNVVNFTGVTTNSIDPSLVGKNTDWEQFDSVMVVGWNKDKDLYVAMSDPSIPECIYLLEVTKHYLLEG